MTKTSARGLDADMLAETQVVEYLQHNPDFFEHNASLLAKLRLPHDRGPATVSLVERQVHVLREKNLALESKLREFVDVARGNDALSIKIHRFACRLIRARGAAQIIEVLESSLRDDFGASEWLWVATHKEHSQLARIDSRHLRNVDRASADLKMFDTFFESARPRCGQIRDTQRDYLFGVGTVEIGSVALVPLGPKSSYGFLAIGSPDAERFHPTMSTDYLAQIGELVSAAVEEL
jgi:uncharacterized protein YigA (DUF484 family)